ncbi:MULTISPECIES: DegT/DnrJ/EryC1/StrS family aminotransferase [Legionella]|uniref:DegT/DnrJ/EryC1/StrS family aminotransferase n=1 Tax=Legionella septentrionalis TaxID=2498109 RepID=A0A433JK56_9GAMM|nr:MULTISPECIES: DegT/DnrJ/EryC1/StrS family aminotransferase [Legionella]MCP0914338.1 DegT/DnrJ/EryC1/StrS family aminotransferase [Legionella sp. 27cVA30]RUQ89001.1 DegT/DnrJ/EryC1/StrS family aminotransferase [Legionella septentrionalis]RUR00308.1 DegT/DnrJ/EryC1/StrS family aminotransferase [Legionella septentrionalis]RUR11835.1 DegT/DnrJ/EryC1/StrS family aminotransferase [Legionella septentrionalis]
MQFIDLKTQSNRIEDRLIARFKDVLNHGAYIMGPEITELETALANYVGVSHALAVASGTDALLIALMALGVGAGDEVITTPFSFFATAEVIALLGAKPVFVDIHPDTYNIDASLIEAAITAKTKAIIPVSLYGQCADYDEINAIAKKYNLPVIEDAAQSFGATYQGKQSCGLTTIGCTSFFPSKPLGCYGDGGACFTNDAELAQRMNEIRTHGQSRRYHHTRLGINGRLDTIQAAILLEKLAIFPEEVVLRQEVADRYQQLLPAEIRKPVVKTHNTSVFAQYTIEVSNRDAVQQALQKLGIPTAVHYPAGLHEQPIFKELFPGRQSYPHTENAARRVMSIPMHPYLTIDDQQKICGALKEVLREKVGV